MLREEILRGAGVEVTALRLLRGDGVCVGVVARGCGVELRGVDTRGDGVELSEEDRVERLLLADGKLVIDRGVREETDRFELGCGVELLTDRVEGLGPTARVRVLTPLRFDIPESDDGVRTDREVTCCESVGACVADGADRVDERRREMLSVIDRFAGSIAALRTRAVRLLSVKAVRTPRVLVLRLN